MGMVHSVGPFTAADGRLVSLHGIWEWTRSVVPFLIWDVSSPPGIATSFGLSLPKMVTTRSLTWSPIDSAFTSFIPLAVFLFCQRLQILPFLPDVLPITPNPLMLFKCFSYFHPLFLLIMTCYFRWQGPEKYMFSFRYLQKHETYFLCSIVWFPCLRMFLCHVVNLSCWSTSM